MNRPPSAEGAAEAGGTPRRGPWSRAWRGLRSRWYGRLLVDLLIVTAVVWAVGRFQARDLLADETVAPGLARIDLAGQRVDLETLRGRKVLVHFFAPWCGVCRMESDNWDRVQATHPNMRVLAVALAWEDAADVRSFFGEALPNHPVLLGQEADQAAWRVTSFPTHYLLDEHGRIIWQGAGYTPTVAFWLRLL
jgi:thiol-disulfide isomerase/thioredoxin